MSSNPAYQRLLSDYVDYHLTFLVIGGLFTLLLLLSSGFFWLRFGRASRVGGHTWTFERRTYFVFGITSLLAGLAMALVYAANVTAVANPEPGLAGAIGTSGTPQPMRLAAAYQAWMRSGRADIPPLIQTRIEDRLAWQFPKTVICSLLLVVLVWLSMRLWRALISRTKPHEGWRHRLRLASATISAIGCFVLMLMVIGNAEAVIAPVTLTLMYG